eukprot:11786151-Alexandrium_andersonii.AAC.1
MAQCGQLAAGAWRPRPWAPRDATIGGQFLYCKCGASPDVSAGGAPSQGAGWPRPEWAECRGLASGP